LDAENVYKTICLPAVAELEGTPLLVPRSTSNIHKLLETLGGGTCIQCENEEIMEAMMVSTCMMGPVYGLMRANRDFLIKKGVPAKDANHVVARQYFGMTQDALARSEDGDDSLDALIQEQTPGGLNEQTLKNLESLGLLKSYDDVMEAVLGRIQGKYDGSLK
jgi:pyrroline-5-carboxylate reductase